MQLTIRGKNIEVTDALRNYAEKKLGKIDKYFDQPLSAQVNMYVERERHVVEVTASLNGLLLRGEEASNDMYASIDRVADKLERQVRKYKTRLNRRSRREGLPVEPQPVHEEPEGKVVKTKHFLVKPLTVDEAILQMNLLGHDFFVFTNADTNRINVLYLRKDGNYGLIDPET